MLLKSMQTDMHYRKCELTLILEKHIALHEQQTGYSKSEIMPCLTKY
jgi:hypothetical protein